MGVFSTRCSVSSTHRGLTPFPSQRTANAAARLRSRPVGCSQASHTANQAHSSLREPPGRLQALVTSDETCDATLREDSAVGLTLPIEAISFAEFALGNATESSWGELISIADDGEDTFFHATCRSKVSRRSRGSGAMVKLVCSSGLEQTVWNRTPCKFSPRHLDCTCLEHPSTGRHDSRAACLPESKLHFGSGDTHWNLPEGWRTPEPPGCCLNREEAKPSTYRPVPAIS